MFSLLFDLNKFKFDLNKSSEFGLLKIAFKNLKIGEYRSTMEERSLGVLIKMKEKYLIGPRCMHMSAY